MKLYVDLDKLELIEGPGFRNPVSALRFKRGDAARLEVMFLANGSTAATIGDPATLEIHFGAKLNGQYGTDYIVHTADWTMPDPEATTPVYSCSPSFNTVALNDALAIGGTELAETTLMGELTWREGTGEPTSTRTVLVVVDNDVNRGTEGTPVSGPTPDEWLDTSAVRHDSLQYLSDAAKRQARTNIGTGSGSDMYATTKLINAGELLLDDILTIGDLTYTMVATPSFPGDVLAEAGMQPIIDAINGDALNASHPLVMASDAGGGDMLIRALVPGPEGNGIYVYYGPYGAATAYWEEGATLGGGNSLLADTMGASSRLSNATEVDDVSTGYLLIQKAQDNPRFVSFSLLLLWSWIKSKLDLALTLSGTKTFTGQVELTGQSATNGTSAMTRDLARQQRQLLDAYDNWDLFGSLFGMGSGGSNGAGSYATGGQAQSGTAIGGWARMVLATYTTRPGGAGANNGLCSVPIAVALVGSFSPGTGSAVRIIFGAKASGTPYWSTQNPLAARGFGLEIYVVTGIAKMRLFTHNGTTFNYGTAQNFAGIWTGVCHLVIAHNGAGRVQVYHAGSDSHVGLGTPVLQSAMTMYTGPTSGTYGEEGAISMEAVGNNTIASAALGNVMRGRMFLNHSL